MTYPTNSFLKDGRRGSALLIVLAFIVLLTGLLVAYLALTKTDRQLANSSFNGSKVDQMATSALEVIVGDLKQEIVNGSTLSVVSGEPIYIPTANADMIPMRIGNPPIVGGVDPIPNLVRISTHTDASPTAPLVSSRASNLASTVASTNGRSITRARWNQHYLIPRIPSEVGTAAFQSDPVTSFTPPDWVFVTREEGPDALTSPILDASGNTVTPIGRYAYAIYDEGGILDLNVAGFPSGTTPTQEGGKGNIAYADLTALGLTQSQVDQIVGWRNYASAQPTGSGFPASFVFGSGPATHYFNMVTSNDPLNGAMKVATNASSGTPPQTDQAFVSRQDLISLWGSQSLSPDILQYVGTFSREKNAPSWHPYYDAPTLGGTAVTTYDYKSNADSNPAPTNSDLFNTKLRLSGTATITSYTLNGTAVQIHLNKGDPVVRRRFCLGRLAWITSQGPSADLPTSNPLYNPGGTDVAIKQYFGLVWGTGPELPTGMPCWVYTSPTGTGTTGATTSQTSIRILSAVASLLTPREPDFFELLKAGILSGSIGMDGGVVNTGSSQGPAGDTRLWDQQTDNQIFQIGANIIDQYTSDNYPTEITGMLSVSGTNTQFVVYGIKNLPYLYGIYFAAIRNTNNFLNVGGWYIPVIWNPHQNTATSIPSSPSNFRFIASGTSKFSINIPSSTVVNASPVNLASDTNGVQFTISPTEPTLLLQSNATSATAADLVTSATMTNPSVTSRNYIGLFGGTATDPNSADTPSSLTNYTQATLAPSPSLYFYLQYQDPNNNNAWRTYTVLKLLENSVVSGSWCDIVTGSGETYYAARSDPRTDRFSLSEVYQYMDYSVGNSGAGIPGRTLWPCASSASIETMVWFAPSNSNFIYKGSGTEFSGGPRNNWNNPWQLSENRPTPSGSGNGQGNGGAGVYGYEYYTDLDGVYRRADGAYAVVNSPDGHPLAATAQTIYAPYYNSISPTIAPSYYTSPGAPFTGTTGAMASRPIILSRPFRSVGELGYAFRDEPWKHIDFFTPESADSALLDLFSVDDGDITAGRVSLNTRQAPVLQAILSGAIKNSLTPSQIGSTSDALTLANAIVTSTTGGTSGVTLPFLNRSELVNRFKSGAESDPRTFISSLTPLSFSATTDNTVKAQRESIIRSLGDATTTRTWNLLIDVVAQSGHYPPGANASTPLSQFIVDGERRYWLHIAIDRYTGQVVDRVLEPVYE